MAAWAGFCLAVHGVCGGLTVQLLCKAWVWFGFRCWWSVSELFGVLLRLGLFIYLCDTPPPPPPTHTHIYICTHTNAGARALRGRESIGFISRETVCIVSAVRKTVQRRKSYRNTTLDFYRYSVPTPFIFTGAR